MRAARDASLVSWDVPERTGMYGAYSDDLYEAKGCVALTAERGSFAVAHHERSAMAGAPDP